MDLTTPITFADIRTTFPRDAAMMQDAEIGRLLEIEEHALRADFGVTGTANQVNEALSRAMIAAWPSFLQQVRNVSQESAGSTVSVMYARAGVIDFQWPKFIGSILAEHSDLDESASGPATTEFVR